MSPKEGVPEREPRVAARLVVRYRLTGQDEFVNRYSRNVSANGMFIATTEQHPPGTVLEFEIQSAEGATLFKGRGSVRWSRPHAPDRSQVGGVGIQFTDLDAPSRTTLQMMLKNQPRAAPPSDAADEKPVEGVSSMPKWASTAVTVVVGVLLVAVGFGAGWYCRGALDESEHHAMVGRQVPVKATPTAAPFKPVALPPGIKPPAPVAPTPCVAAEDGGTTDGGCTPVAPAVGGADAGAAAPPPAPPHPPAPTTP